jgi:hypothetical protein
MEDSMERLERLVCVEPPAELDRCVYERLQVAVAIERSSRESSGGAESSGRSHPGLPLPVAERLVYATGLLAYGCQALGAVVRVVWRVVVG